LADGESVQRISPHLLSYFHAVSQYVYALSRLHDALNNQLNVDDIRSPDPFIQSLDLDVTEFETDTDGQENSGSQNTREGTRWGSSLKSRLKSFGWSLFWYGLGLATKATIQSMKASGPGPQAVPVVESFPCDSSDLYPLLEPAMLF
jgi:hypothetical protein